ncbi:MAG: carboxypeptidase-like regulatory domain-containing protein [Myxococcales bacterium]
MFVIRGGHRINVRVVVVGLRLAALVALPSLSPSAAAAAFAPPSPELARRGTFTIRGQVLASDGPVAGAAVIATVEGGAEVLSALPCPFDCGDKPLIHVVGIPRCFDSESTWGPLAAVVLSGRGQPEIAARTVSRADGSFVLEGLETGRFTLWADLPGKLVGFRTGVAAGATKVTVEVTPSGFIRGKLVDSADRPLAGAPVTAALLEPTRYFDSVTRADGSFSIGPMPRGLAMVVARFEGLLPEHELVLGPDVVRPISLWSPSTKTLGGTVLRSGAPASGSTVSLGDRQTTTGADGSFSFANVEPGEYWLQATLGPLLATALVQVPLVGRDVLDHRLELGPSGEIGGSLRLGTGKPAAGVKVTCDYRLEDGRWRPVDATSGADGRYRFPLLAPEQYQCKVEDARLLREVRDVALQAGEALAVDFTLKAASPITGVVVDEAGKPVAEVDIRATSKAKSDDYAGATSRGDGSFSLGGLPAGSYEVEFQKPHFPSMTTTLTAPSSGARIVLRKGLEAFGVVVGPDQRPVADAEVSLSRPPGESPNEWWWSARTNVRGEFRIPGMTAGTYRLVASAPDQSDAAATRTAVALSAKATGPFRLQLPKGLSITGMVTRPDGTPVARASVKLEQKSHVGPKELPGAAPRWEVWSHSADDGSFAFTNLAPGTYELGCDQWDDELHLPKGESLVVASGGDPITVVLIHDARAVGRVVHESGEPLPLFEIDGRTQSDPEGRFRFVESRERARVLVFSAEGFAPVRRQVEFRQGQESNLGDVVLKVGRTLRGTVLDVRTGSPIAGARVAAGAADLVRPLDPEPRVTAATTTGADGTFTLAHLEQGPLTLVASAPGHRFFWCGIGLVEESVTLELGSGADLHGRVSDAADRPMKFGHILALESSGRFRKLPLENGEYRLDGVAPGRLIIKADAPEDAGNFMPQVLEVPESGELRVDFRERPGSVHLEITGVPDGFSSVLVPGEVPAPESRSLSLLLLALTHQSHLEPGTYSLFIIQRDPPYAVRRQLVHLGDAPEQSVSVELPAGR